MFYLLVLSIPVFTELCRSMFSYNCFVMSGLQIPPGWSSTDLKSSATCSKTQLLFDKLQYFRLLIRFI